VSVDTTNVSWFSTLVYVSGVVASKCRRRNDAAQFEVERDSRITVRWCRIQQSF